MLPSAPPAVLSKPLFSMLQPLVPTVVSPSQLVLLALCLLLLPDLSLSGDIVTFYKVDQDTNSSQVFFSSIVSSTSYNTLAEKTQSPNVSCFPSSNDHISLILNFSCIKRSNWLFDHQVWRDSFRNGRSQLSNCPWIFLSISQEFNNTSSWLANPELNSFHQWLWLVSTPSSSPISFLKQSEVQNQEIIVKKLSKLQFLGGKDWVFLKPVPKWVLSKLFWSHILGSPLWL